jgi:DNA-binding response OmpR family regulator
MENGKIAVINADGADAEIVSKVLSAEGYAVITVENAMDAVPLIEKEDPNLLILGMRPGDHAANAMLDILFAKGIEIPTLVITTADLITDNLAQKGIAGLLIKPIDRVRLAAHVNAIFDIQRSIAREAPAAETASAAKLPEPVKEIVPQPAPSPAEPSHDEVHQGEAPAEAESGKPLVLVVDDEPDMQTLLKDLLDFSGFEVITAGDGVEGMQMAQQRHPAAILLDIMLPKLDGFQVCRLLKFNERYRSIPIIMLTARNHPRDKALAEGNGADAYVVKPFETKDLVGEIKRVIEAAKEKAE